MKILIVTPIYLQDKYPIAHILRGLVHGLMRKNTNVSVLTTKCNDKMRIKDSFCVDAISIGYYEGPSLAKKFFNMVSISSLFTMRLAVMRKPDLIYCPVPPNMIALFIIIVAMFRNVKVVINTQDIHPDVQINLKLVKNRCIINLLKSAENFMLKSVSGAVVIAKSFAENLKNKHPTLNVKVIPNWVDLDFYKISQSDNILKDEWGIDKDKFVVLYAGTFGRIHGTQLILEVAQRSFNANLIFLLVGHGADFERCQQFAIENKLNNVIMKKAVEYHLVPLLQQISNLSIVAMLPETSSTSLPSKMLAYMAASKPILALVESDSEVASIINQSNCGFVDSSYNPSEIAFLINYIASNHELCESMSLNSRLFAVKAFGLDSYVENHFIYFKGLICDNT